MRLSREAERWLDEEVEAVVRQLTFVEHPRYALQRLAAIYRITKIGQLHPGGTVGGLLIRNKEDTFTVLLRGRGTRTLYGLETMAHEIGHIILDGRVMAAVKKLGMDFHTGVLVGERLVESFALRLTRRLWRLWIEQWWQ